ncbi:hypothetical protein [Absidia glauca]|uniref:Uncharacterized protein n=1 Tax=Absidia glauca TaxID=4829 RepID=A0A168QN15_ABSGL|nr:hypothetical protein [Absidia glauca]
MHCNPLPGWNSNPPRFKAGPEFRGEEKLTEFKNAVTSVVMNTGIRPKDSALQQCNGYGIYNGRALSCDIKQWASRHRRHCLRYRRRHRLSRDLKSKR